MTAQEGVEANECRAKDSVQGGGERTGDEGGGWNMYILIIKLSFGDYGIVLLCYF